MSCTEQGHTDTGETDAIDLDAPTELETDATAEGGARSDLVVRASRPPRYPTLEAASLRFRGSMWRERALG